MLSGAPTAFDRRTGNMGNLTKISLKCQIPRGVGGGAWLFLDLTDT